MNGQAYKTNIKIVAGKSKARGKAQANLSPGLGRALVSGLVTAADDNSLISLQHG